MNKTIKDLLIFAIGVGAGALLGYSISESRHKDEVLTNYKEMEAYYETKYNPAPENDSVEEEVIDDTKFSNVTKANDISINITEKPPIVDYTKNYVTDDVNDSIDYNDIYKASYYKESDAKPYFIDEDEFEDVEFNKVYLNVYLCGTVTDDSDIVIDNVDEVIGADILEKFMRENVEEVYVRNPKLRLDYELTKIDEKF